MCTWRSVRSKLRTVTPDQYTQPSRSLLPRQLRQPQQPRQVLPSFFLSINTCGLLPHYRRLSKDSASLGGTVSHVNSAEPRQVVLYCISFLWPCLVLRLWFLDFALWISLPVSCCLCVWAGSTLFWDRPLSWKETLFFMKTLHCPWVSPTCHHSKNWEVRNCGSGYYIFASVRGQCFVVWVLIRTWLFNQESAHKTHCHKIIKLILQNLLFQSNRTICTNIL